jgi:hypothetical protein
MYLGFIFCVKAEIDGFSPTNIPGKMPLLNKYTINLYE